MDVLWVTRLIPYPPFYGGDALYSSNLIEALAAAGVQMTVVCSDQGGGQPPEIPGVTWAIVPLPRRDRLGSLLRSAPSIVYRFSTPAIRQAVEAHLHRQWDAVVIDNLAMAHALSPGLAARPDPPIAYVSHNHESSLRAALARSVSTLSLRGLALRFDARKAARVEHDLVARSELVTTTTSDDLDRFRGAWPAKKFLVLTPGYAGAKMPARRIDEQTPRRILLLGSYGWIAKQLNLERFLDSANRSLEAAGIEVDVVGPMPPDLNVRLRSKFPRITLVGPVDDAAPYLARSRVGIVAEALGGGFKLKALDYMFNRLPIAALEGSMAGLPLQAGRDFLSFSTLDALVEGVVSVVDDLPRLNALQETAYQAGEERFAWPDRGRDLREALDALTKYNIPLEDSPG